MTNGILKSTDTKDKLYKKLVKMDMEDVQYTRLKAEFIHCKNTLRRSINAAKRLYYLRTFALYRNDIKQTWSVIKDTMQKKLHSAPSNKFILNNATIADPDEIANEFNKYFINIGRALSDEIQSIHSSQDYLPQQNTGACPGIGKGGGGAQNLKPFFFFFFCFSIFQGGPSSEKS